MDPRHLRLADEVRAVAADGVELTGEQPAKLDALPPAAGDHHDEEQLRMIER
ncbi:hypothetical protein [Nonomuraea rhodomycinica]|uniref:hypothetical protein n=1 Tax=Nonomuraea rhodomycinica TaxID=1712872 RepID=UPI001C377D4E|nr:hypothetical protein [Nonomuraea rhodomycinica]